MIMFGDAKASRNSQKKRDAVRSGSSRNLIVQHVHQHTWSHGEPSLPSTPRSGDDTMVLRCSVHPHWKRIFGVAKWNRRHRRSMHEDTENWENRVEHHRSRYWWQKRRSKGICGYSRADLSVPSGEDGDNLSHEKTQNYRRAGTARDLPSPHEMYRTGIHKISQRLAWALERVSEWKNTVFALQGKTLAIYAPETPCGISLTHDQSAVFVYVSNISRAPHAEYDQLSRWHVFAIKKSTRYSSRFAQRQKIQTHSRNTQWRRLIQPDDSSFKPDFFNNFQFHRIFEMFFWVVKITHLLT